MFKKIMLSTAVAVLLSTTLAQAEAPTSDKGKIYTSILQTVNKYPWMTSFLVADTTGLLFQACSKNITPSQTFLFAAIAWIGGGFMVRTGSKALMNNFDIQPLN